MLLIYFGNCLIEYIFMGKKCSFWTACFNKIISIVNQVKYENSIKKKIKRKFQNLKKKPHIENQRW